MKRVVTTAIACFAMPFAAGAQSTTTTTPASPAAPAVAASVLNGDTPIETVMASPNGKAAIEKVFPEIPGHPAYDQFKVMSLRQLQPLAGGIVTDEKIAAFEAAAKPK